IPPGQPSVPRIAERFNLPIRIKAVGLGKLFENWRALLRPRVWSKDQHAKKKIDNGSLLNGPTLSWRVLLWHPWCELSGCRLLFRADKNLEGGICLDRAIRCPPRLRHDAPHNPEMAEDFPHYNRIL